MCSGFDALLFWSLAQELQATWFVIFSSALFASVAERGKISTVLGIMPPPPSIMPFSPLDPISLFPRGI